MTILVDLCQPIETGMTIFPGDPIPGARPAEGVLKPWQVTEMHLGSHTGTHIDCASHLLPAGKTVDQYPLERFILSGIVLPLVGLSDNQAISEEQILNVLNKLPEGGAVLIKTGWDQYWKTDRYLRHPYLSKGAANLLVKVGARVVGIDALNVDSTASETDHVHYTLLEKDILIVENLAHLNELEPGRVHHFSFLPLLWPGLDASPIRAVAW